MVFLVEESARAVTLAEHVKDHPPKLFIATKGSEMPNTTDQTNTLKENDRALLLSSAGLTDITGLSQLRVEDDGKIVPLTSVKNLHLFFNHNEITFIPDEIGRLKNVVYIYFEFNQLRVLPRALLDMDSLIGMFFTANQFKEIPSLVFDMPRLRKLQFSKNRIRVLPPEIGRLTELRHFNIADNQIAVIPEPMAKLTRLRVCDLSDNCIASLPEAFGKVQIVNQLRVRNNPLTNLPAGFATMRATIDISGTQIKIGQLPPELRTKIDTEKPAGSKDPDKQIVKRGGGKTSNKEQPGVPQEGGPK